MIPEVIFLLLSQESFLLFESLVLKGFILIDESPLLLLGRQLSKRQGLSGTSGRHKGRIHSINFINLSYFSPILLTFISSRNYTIFFSI